MSKLIPRTEAHIAYLEGQKVHADKVRKCGEKAIVAFNQSLKEHIMNTFAFHVVTSLIKSKNVKVIICVKMSYEKS